MCSAITSCSRTADAGWLWDKYTTKDLSESPDALNNTEEALEEILPEIALEWKTSSLSSLFPPTGAFPSQETQNDGMDASSCFLLPHWK